MCSLLHTSYSLNCIGASSANPGELEQVPGWQRVKANPSLEGHTAHQTRHMRSLSCITAAMPHKANASTFPFIICMLRHSVLARLHCTKQLSPDVRQVGLVGNVHTVVQCVSAHNAPISTGQHQAARAAWTPCRQQHQLKSGGHSLQAQCWYSCCSHWPPLMQTSRIVE